MVKAAVLAAATRAVVAAAACLELFRSAYCKIKRIRATIKIYLIFCTCKAASLPASPTNWWVSCPIFLEASCNLANAAVSSGAFTHVAESSPKPFVASATCLAHCSNLCTQA